MRRTALVIGVLACSGAMGCQSAQERWTQDGVARMEEKDWPGAEADLGRALDAWKSAPMRTRDDQDDEAATWYLLGQCREMQKNLAGASDAYAEGLERCPRAAMPEVIIRFGLIDADIRLGRIQDAADAFGAIRPREGEKEFDEFPGVLIVCAAMTEREVKAGSGRVMVAVACYAYALYDRAAEAFREMVEQPPSPEYAAFAKQVLPMVTRRAEEKAREGS